MYLIASNKLKTPKIFDVIKFLGLSIDLSTWVSDAKLKIAFGLYFSKIWRKLKWVYKNHIAGE